MAEYRTKLAKPLPWREFRKHARRPIWVPFYFIEWICAHGAYRLSRWSFLHLLEYVSSLSILLATILWFSEMGERTQQRHYQAWQVINTAQGKGGSGGRLDALEQLAADGVELVGVDVSLAYLRGLKLDGAELRRADFHAADLRQASFRRAKMEDTNFVDANLRSADLSYADLSGADFTNADLTGANLEGALLTGALFDKADLTGINVKGAKDWRPAATQK